MLDAIEFFSRETRSGYQRNTVYVEMWKIEELCTKLPDNGMKDGGMLKVFNDIACTETGIT